MNILLASTSALFGEGYLEYLKEEIRTLFAGIDEIVFIPYARSSGMTYEEYTVKAKRFFSKIGIHTRGVHEFDSEVEAIRNAKAYFVGGGNTFLLVKKMHQKGLMKILKENILSGKPYLGTSAGSNIGGINMMTTNDMPIVYPSSFDCMALIPYNINPHYLDPQPQLKHAGETRETRILEFLTQNDITVLGLREGNWIRQNGEIATIEGSRQTRVFKKNEIPFEVDPGTVLDF